MRAFTKASAVALSLGLVLAGCSDDDDGEEADNTTSTTAAAPSLKSESAVAVALDDTILSGQELQAALGLSAEPAAFLGTAAAPPPPQGPLSLEGIIKVYPDAYRGLLEHAAVKDGANRTYLTPAGVVNILSIRFANVTVGGSFFTSANQLATTFAGGKVNEHADVAVGVTPGAVLIVPPASPSTHETVVMSALYQDGIFYQVSVSAPPGATKDDFVISILKAQDAKYQGKKGSIPRS